jgi:hypothetical protein
MRNSLRGIAGAESVRSNAPVWVSRACGKTGGKRETRRRWRRLRGIGGGRSGVSFYANANEKPARGRRFFRGHPAHALHRPRTHPAIHTRARARACSSSGMSIALPVIRAGYRGQLHSVFSREPDVGDGAIAAIAMPARQATRRVIKLIRKCVYSAELPRSPRATFRLPPANAGFRLQRLPRRPR